MNARVIKTGCQVNASFAGRSLNNAIAIQEAATMLLRITAYQMDVAVMVDNISDRPLFLMTSVKKKLKKRKINTKKRKYRSCTKAPWEKQIFEVVFFVEIQFITHIRIRKVINVLVLLERDQKSFTHTII